MKLHLAGLGSTKKEFLAEIKAEFPEIGALAAFPNKNQVDKLLSAGFEVIIDSGAFPAYNSGKAVDIDKLAEFLRAYQDNEKVICISLDVIDDKEQGWESLRNWDYLIEKGIKCVPTYHLGEDRAVLDYYASKTKYIGIGGIAGVPVKWDKVVEPIQEFFHDYPDHHFHLFGVNDVKVVQRFEFFSCDALTWRVGSRFGEIITPLGRYALNPRSRHLNTERELKESGMFEWLVENDIPYPLPEGFDHTRLDKLNIKMLWREIVEFHRNGLYEGVPFSMSIF